MPRNARETRHALLEAGRRLFARLGYEGASTRAIADEAGVNQGLIGYHFGGKQGLFTAIVLDDLEGARARLTPVMASGKPAPERLRDFVTALAEYGRERPHFPFILTREQMDGARHLDPEARRRFFGFFEGTRGILEEGVGEGAFRPVDPHATHLSLVGSLAYFALTRPARERYIGSGQAPATTLTDDEYLEHILELFTRGLAA